MKQMTNEELNEFREKCYLDLAYFSKSYFQYTGVDYEEKGYDAIIYNTLQRKLIDPDDTKNLIINIPPRTGKSMRMRLAIAWQVYTSGGDCNFIITSYSDEFARQQGKEIREILNSTFFKILTTDIRCSQSEASKGLLGIDKIQEDGTATKTGGIRCVSQMGQITGFGAGSLKAAKGHGALIIDDPNNTIDETDLSLSEPVKAYTNVLRRRINHRHTPIIVIQQRMNVQDFTGYLLSNEPERWDTLVLPVMDDEGRLLDPVRYPIEEIEQERAADLPSFNAQLMQKPMRIETQQPIDVSKIKFYHSEPTGLDLAGYTILASADYAVTEKDTADYSCCFVAAKKGQSLIVLDWFMSKEITKNTIPRTIKLIEKWEPLYLYLESGTIFNAMENDLYTYMADAGVYCDIEKYRRGRNKLAMSQSFIVAVKEGYVQMPAGIDGEILKQMRDFPNGVHDDAVDALAGFYIGHRGEFNDAVTSFERDKSNFDFTPQIESF